MGKKKHAVDPLKPYNRLPLLPPKAELETKAVLKACVAARAALAELKASGGLIPNQAVLINAIPLLEARDSSAIENVVTTNDKLYQAALDEDGKHDPGTKEVVRYRRALREGFEGLKKRPLSTNLFRSLCATIKGREVDVRKVTDTTLKNQDGKVVYTPPVGADLLRDLLANLELYLHAEDDLDPLVRMAVAHYQFEAIHPFLDGNGRTGRIINILFLVERGLLDLPVLYLSRFIIVRKAEYYRLLAGVTTNNSWEPWILFMLEAVADTARETVERIRRIRDLFDAACERVRRELPKTYSKELMEVLFELPYCRINVLVERGIAQRQTAATYLDALEKIGILKSEQKGRDKLFRNLELEKALRN
ncbi:MAG TPA: addiction module protein [Desulfovibrio sp.]|nr:addiction module protein [Desulfovibrio sp.]